MKPTQRVRIYPFQKWEVDTPKNEIAMYEECHRINRNDPENEADIIFKKDFITLAWSMKREAFEASPGLALMLTPPALPDGEEKHRCKARKQHVGSQAKDVLRRILPPSLCQLG